MATGKSTMQIKHLDRRLAERYLRRGVISDKDYKQYLKDLPDLDGHYEVMTLPEAPSKKTDEADAQ